MVARVSDLNVPKRNVRLELKLTSGQWQAVELFLANVAAGHHGSESVEDVLNGRNAFFPVRIAGEDGIRLIGREKVCLAKLPLDPEPTTPEEPDIELVTRHEADLHLEDGECLRGVAEFIRPKGHARLLDFLNEETTFFRFIGETHAYLVNKKHVIQVEFLSFP